MSEISKISSEIRIADMADLAGTMIRELDQSAIDDAHLAALQSAIEPLSTKLVKAINKDKAESDLERFDAARDEVYRSLLYLCKGYLHHPDKTVSAAARGVDAIIDKYGFKLVEAAYSAQSALLDSFMADMSRPSIAAHVDLLPGVKALLEQLAGQQDGFKAAEALWVQARSAQNADESATSIKKELLKLLNNKLVVYLRAMYQVNPEPYNELIAKIALLIDQANALIKRRHSRADEVQAGSN